MNTAQLFFRVGLGMTVIGVASLITLGYLTSPVMGSTLLFGFGFLALAIGAILHDETR